MPEIEVFKTDILTEDAARQLLTIIQQIFPEYNVNFDLSDCDRVMRVVSPVDVIDVGALMQIAVRADVHIAPLPDEVPG